jgi:tetratricopeptide (TPR) repeat protein
MSTKLRGLVILSLLFLLPVALLAQSQARVYGEVTDETGKPVEGALITVTTSALESFKLQVTTDAKGHFTFALLDATKTYSYRVEKEGYAPHEEELKVGIGQNVRHNFRLLSAAAAAAQGVGGGSPAVLAYNAGAEAFNQGDYVAARARLEEAIAADPQMADAHAALAHALLKSGDAAAAARSAEAALAIDSGNLNALRAALGAYQSLGDSAKIKTAEAALASADPAAAASGAYGRGVDLYNGGSTAEAIVEFEAALAAAPDHAKSHYMLGLCYSGTGDTVKARAHLERFLELAPSDADAPLAQEMLKYLK